MSKTIKNARLDYNPDDQVITPKQWALELEHELQTFHEGPRIFGSGFRLDYAAHAKGAKIDQTEAIRLAEVHYKHLGDLSRHLYLSFHWDQARDPEHAEKVDAEIPAHIERVTANHVRRIAALKDSPLSALRGMADLNRTDNKKNLRVFVDPTVSFLPQYVDRAQIAGAIRDIFKLATETPAPDAAINREQYLLRELGMVAGYIENPKMEWLNRAKLQAAIKTTLGIYDLLGDGTKHSQGNIDAAWNALHERNNPQPPQSVLMR